jgi:hypothetical protein
MKWNFECQASPNDCIHFREQNDARFLRSKNAIASIEQKPEAFSFVITAGEFYFFESAHERRRSLPWGRKKTNDVFIDRCRRLSPLVPTRDGRLFTLSSDVSWVQRTIFDQTIRAISIRSSRASREQTWRPRWTDLISKEFIKRVRCVDGTHRLFLWHER